MEVSVALHYRPGRGAEVQPGLVVLDRPSGRAVRGQSGASAMARHGACSTASLPGQGCSEDGRQQWRCSMAALPGRGSVQGCRRACGRGMMACSALLSGSREAEQGREKAEREERG